MSGPRVRVWRPCSRQWKHLQNFGAPLVPSKLTLSMPLRVCYTNAVLKGYYSNKLKDLVHPLRAVVLNLVGTMAWNHGGKKFPTAPGDLHAYFHPELHVCIGAAGLLMHSSPHSWGELGTCHPTAGPQMLSSSQLRGKLGMRTPTVGPRMHSSPRVRASWACAVQLLGCVCPVGAEYGAESSRALGSGSGTAWQPMCHGPPFGC